jgi:hypothetical protein
LKLNAVQWWDFSVVVLLVTCCALIYSWTSLLPRICRFSIFFPFS